MKKQIISIILMLVIFTGCSSNHIQDIEPEYKQAKTVLTENQGNQRTEKEGITSEETIEELEEVNFLGIDEKGKILQLGSQGVNNRCTYGENYFCFDSETESIYYVNYGNDNYLYRLKGNKKELILDKFVTCVNILDNVLYFIYAENPEYNPDVQLSYKGNLYSYDLETKELVCLSKEKLGWILAVPEGIYGHFGFDSKKYERKIYFYNFQKKTWELAFKEHKASTEKDLCFYKDFYLKEIWNQNGNYMKTVWHRELDGKEIDFLGSKQYPWGGEFVYSNHLYARIANPYNEKEELYLCMIDLKDGKQYQYKTEDGSTLKSVLCSVEINGKLYTGSTIADEILVGDVCAESMHIMHIKEAHNHFYNRLYTDGKRLFGLYNKGKSYGMVELLISDDEIKEIEIGK